jgi:hypothetical protein
LGSGRWRRTSVTHVPTESRSCTPIGGVFGEGDLSGVGVEERRVGHELAGAVDLQLADVHAGDSVAALGQGLGDGDSAAAAQIKNVRVGG